MKLNKFKCTVLSAALALAAMTSGCDTLDIKNLQSYGEDLVWADANMATAFVNNLYAETFPNWTSHTDADSEQLRGVTFYLGLITETGDSYKSWNYTTVRHINEAIQRLEDPACELKPELAKSLLGQCYFMRAYTYYWMVCHHGGVPYIKVPQDKDKDDLYVKRNSTAECFQFMVEDLDKAISMVPDKIASSSSDFGRIDKAFAKSWKAKTLLLKCSPQFNPKNPYDNKYWDEAYTAAKEAYDFCVTHGSSLHPVYGDIWLEEGNSEVVFAVINSAPNRYAGWEDGSRPASISRNPNYRNPTWEMVKLFPMADGKAYDDPTGAYCVGNEEGLLQSFWKNRDPRFGYSVMINAEEYPVAGKPAGYRQYNALGIANGDDQYGINPNAHTNAVHNDDYTGFYMKKGCDNSLSQDKVQAYDKDFVLMRFAEVMFMYAETANETNKPDVARSMLKELRKRAGIEKGADELYGLKVANREEIRDAILFERGIELCFEGHRFWDIRRAGRIMELNGLIKHGVEAIAVNADGTEMDMTTAKNLANEYKLTPDNFKYQILRCPYTPAAEHQFVIEERFNFFPIKKAYLDENENLQQNSNWGGSFNPTMD